MNKPSIKVILFLTGILWAIDLNAQSDEQQLVVPLSNPAQPGSLEVSLNSGDIRVTGYPGKEIIIRVATDQKSYEKESRDGLRQIPNNSIGLSAKEENNVVKVNSNNWNKEINLSIQVPVKFNLKLRGLNDGEISVNNVNGEMDVSFINGDITLMDISGSAVVSSQNGDVMVKFNSIKENTPMAFSSFSGDVDVTFPQSVKATVKMRSDHGDLLSDFDMSIKKSAPKIENNRESGVYKIAMEEWVTADINGGGPEFTFKTFNGDILIRKK